MKKIALVLIAPVLLAARFAPAQDEAKVKRFIDAFRPSRTHALPANSTTPASFSTREKSLAANFNRHFEQVARLQAQGKSAAEIRSILGANLAAAGTGKITGMVYQSNGSTPIGVYTSLTAYDEFGRYAGFGSTFGRDPYTIERLETGNYYVHANPIPPYQAAYYGNVSEWRQATLVHVNDGQVTSDVNFRLAKNPVGHGVITGRVLEAAGAPITKDVTIQAHDVQYRFSALVEVDSNGAYVVSGLANGSYLLFANYLGAENLVSEWYDDAAYSETATPIAVTSPDTTRGIDFRLEAGGFIAGQVRAPQGYPPPQTTEYGITLYELDLRPLPGQILVTNEGFLTEKLRPGDYKLLVHYAGPGNFTTFTWHGDVANPETAQAITVQAGDTTRNVNVTLLLGGSISGRALDANGAPLTAGALRVHAVDENENEINAATLGSTGYAMNHLPAGRYKLFAEYTGTPSAQQPVNEWYDGAADFASAQFLEVTAGSTTPNLDFTLQRGGAISGRIAGPLNRHLTSGGRVSVYNLKGARVQFAVHGSNGFYVVAGLRSGEYKLFASNDGQEGYGAQWYGRKQHFSNAATVSVTAPNTTSNRNFTLEVPAKLRGYVTNPAGARLVEEEQNIFLASYDAVTGEYAGFQSNTFVGGYQLSLLSGSYKLAAFDYYTNFLPRQDSLAVAFYENGKSFAEGASVNLAASEVRELNPLILQKTSGAISGTFFQQNAGTPQRTGLYYVFAYDTAGYVAKATAYFEESRPIDGRYQLPGFHPGDYYLLAIAALAPDFEEVVPGQWHGGSQMNLPVISVQPRVTIPPEARPVTVMNGLIPAIDFIFNFTTAVQAREQAEGIRAFALQQNYPNPFNPATTLAYELPKAAHVAIRVFNLLGKEIATLLDQTQTAGAHSVQWNAAHVPSGVYFVQMQAGEFKSVKKCLLLK